MQTTKDAEGRPGEAGKLLPKEEKHNSLKGLIIGIVYACITLFFIAGCGAAMSPVLPATAAPATAAPATAAPATAAPATAAPATLPPIISTPSSITVAPTLEIITPVTTLATAIPQNEILSQLQQIDLLLRQQIIGSIAYNKPESMDLGQTTTIELLLNPSLSEKELGTQVVESGTVQTSTLEITPRMKAVLLSPLAEAFTIQSMHDEVQLISASETTQWSWFVTARKSGTQVLKLVIYRLVQYAGQDYWREVETYTADIEIKVPFAQWMQLMDWKWIISILVALLSLPFVWSWSARRRRNK